MQQCLRRAKFNFIERLQPVEVSAAFQKGDTCHVGLEKYYRAKCLGAELKDARDNAIVEAQKHATTHTTLSPSDIELCINTLAEYFQFYRDERWIPKNVEVPFSKLIYDGPDYRILYEGRIDLIVDSAEGIADVDHKTTSRGSEPVDLRNQFLGYLWATGHKYIFVNQVGFQKTLPPSQKFRRYPISFDPETIRDWEQSAIYYLKLWGDYLQGGVFPPNFSACGADKFSGCIYQGICRHPSVAEETKRFDFKVGEEWDPFKRKG